uniref:Triple QxxK/R motif-containing protein n=1 Tax=Romanomermis culicivorax TaxID=13658 RepID=A0A915JZQ1_ROMCU
MARKDAAAKSAPVDQYRQQIGTQENKKAKKDSKQFKRRAGQKAEKKKATKLGFLILLSFLLLLTTIYLFLYLYLQHESDQVKQFVQSTEKIFNDYILFYANLFRAKLLQYF